MSLNYVIFLLVVLQPQVWMMINYSRRSAKRGQRSKLAYWNPMIVTLRGKVLNQITLTHRISIHE